LERVWTSWLDTSLAQQMHLHHDAAIDLATLRGTLALPAARIRVARDADNRIVGFSTAVPICHDTLALVEGHPGLAKTVQAYVRRLEPGALPQTPAETDTYFFFNLANTESEPVATQQALIRDVFGLFARGGKYLVATPIPPFKTLFETLGFERLPEAQGWFWSDEQPEDGYLLDLTRLGVEPRTRSLARSMTTSCRTGTKTRASPSRRSPVRSPRPTVRWPIARRWCARSSLGHLAGCAPTQARSGRWRCARSKAPIWASGRAMNAWPKTWGSRAPPSIACCSAPRAIWLVPSGARRPNVRPGETAAVLR
jgi:hypothetical protein